MKFWGCGHWVTLELWPVVTRSNYYQRVVSFPVQNKLGTVSRIIILFHVRWNRSRSNKVEREEGSFVLRMFNSFRKTFLSVRIDMY